MKNYIIVSIMFLVSLLTVSTLANADSVAKMNANANANLVIYRPDDGSSLSYRIWVDDQYMGKLELDEVLALQLPAGEHTIRSNDRKRSKLSVTLTEQGTTYVRSEIYRKTHMSLAVDKVEGEVMAGL